jgi:hypothetical protein
MSVDTTRQDPGATYEELEIFKKFVNYPRILCYTVPNNKEVLI